MKKILSKIFISTLSYIVYVNEYTKLVYLKTFCIYLTTFLKFRSQFYIILFWILLANLYIQKSLHRLNRKSMPCSSTRPSLCCAQIINAQKCMSQQTERTFNIYHKLTCKTQYVIYLMECIFCKIQYLGKFETASNFRRNNHTKDVNNPKAIPACHHFKTHIHNFMKHANFTLIEQLTETSNVNKDYS